MAAQRRRATPNGGLRVRSSWATTPGRTPTSPASVASDLTDQIRRNKDFLVNTYGVDGTPYFRPPYGRHNGNTDQVATDLGYPTITLWSATIGDSRPINETDLIAAAAQSFTPQQIVLGHANLPTITRTYDQLLGIIQGRNLQTVTLADVFS